MICQIYTVGATRTCNLQLLHYIDSDSKSKSDPPVIDLTLSSDEDDDEDDNHKIIPPSATR